MSAGNLGADNRTYADMMTLRNTIAIAAATLIATSAFAQEEPAQDPVQEPVLEGDAISDQGLSLGEEIMDDAFGETYLADTFGDWEMRCVRMPDGADPCQMYQLLLDEQGNAVAEISMFGLEGAGEAVAGATIITPLETLLTEQITIRVDGGSARRYPFTWCSAIGCIARVGFTAAEVESFRRGAAAITTIVPVVAPDEQVNLRISLIGFTAAYDAVNEANAGLPLD